MSSFLDNLEWRRAQKSFDKGKTVSDEDLAKILFAIRMAPTSYGLQPLKVFIVENEEKRAQIGEASYGQTQVKDASHLLVFCRRLDVDDRISEFIELLSEGNEAKKESLKSFENTMRASMERRTPQQLDDWANRQVYIALGFAMAACAEMQIDSCPMEGFVPAKVDEILGLKESLKSVVMLPVGYRDETPHREKVRFSDDDLFEVV